MTTDPGSVPRDSVPLADDVQEQDFKAVTMESGGAHRPIGSNRVRTSSNAHIPVMVKKYRKFCKRCRAFKPQRAHHCSICGRCIVKMDHHCPWVNNCVGIGNQKLFLLFLLGVNMCCIYSVVLVIGKYMYCSGLSGTEDAGGISSNLVANVYGLSPQHAEAQNGQHQYFITGAGAAAAQQSGAGCSSADHNLVIVFLLIESILFGLFTLCMMGDQTTVLSTNQTQIDKLKGDFHEGVNGYNEVFGCDSSVKFSCGWLMPYPPVHPDQTTKERILGYRLLSPEEFDKLNKMKNAQARGDWEYHSREPSPSREGVGGGGDISSAADAYSSSSITPDTRKRTGTSVSSKSA